MLDLALLLGIVFAHPRLAVAVEAVAAAEAQEPLNLPSATCSETVILRASRAAPKQGGVFVTEVRSESPLDSVKGRFAGEELYFWHDAEARVFQALVGVDLRAPPGDASLSAQAVPLAGGPPIDCRLVLRVADGAFPVQRLRVAPEFVELSAEDLARSRRESGELDRIFGSITPERLWQSFKPPVTGYEPSGSFGKRRVFNNEPRSPHSGEDFPAPAGSPVRAPGRGRVVLAKGLFFLGNTVVLDHGFGLFSFLGHLSKIDAKLGAMVDGGAVIGEVGATGRVTGAHLHWGVRLGDSRVNPMDLIALAR